jgi:GAF domain-containing protein
VGADDQHFDATADEGLAAGLAGLAHLMAGVGSLEQYLSDVARCAVLAISMADGAGVTMLIAEHADIIVGSDPFVREVDALQYRVGEGPCISAAATGKTVIVGALGEDGTWPTFGPRAAELDIHSAISLPLILDGDVLGALNVYAHQRDAFDESSRAVGELFAGPAAVALYNARVLDEARQTAKRLEGALRARSTTDRAVGIVMSRAGVSADDAYVRLRIISQHEGQPIATIAERLIEDAVRRAKSRDRPADR